MDVRGVTVPLVIIDFDRGFHENKPTNVLFPDLVKSRQKASQQAQSQFTCLAGRMDAPRSAGLADGDSPGASERIQSR